MVSSKNGPRQIIKASIAVFATVALPMTLSIIMAMADHCFTIALDAAHTIGPAVLTN